VFADEDAVPEDDVAEHIVGWPAKWPKGAKSLVRPQPAKSRKTA
jgi:hypothetical protein